MGFFHRDSTPDPIRIVFMCVENAGRSQMAAAFARRECERRGLDDRVSIDSAGTHPADSIHDVVVEAMDEVGIDLSDRIPRVVQMSELKTADFLVTMGCYISEFSPRSFGVDSREWSLVDPNGQDIDAARMIRDDIDARVNALFDELETTVEA